MCVLYYITEDVTACEEQQSRHSTSSGVVRFCSLHAVTTSVIYYSTHARTEKCNPFVKMPITRRIVLVFQVVEPKLAE